MRALVYGAASLSTLILVIIAVFWLGRLTIDLLHVSPTSWQAAAVYFGFLGFGVAAFVRATVSGAP